MLNPMHLRTLGAVLAVGSFADAARRLGYTPSAVSILRRQRPRVDVELDRGVIDPQRRDERHAETRGDQTLPPGASPARRPGAWCFGGDLADRSGRARATPTADPPRGAKSALEVAHEGYLAWRADRRRSPAGCR